MKKVIQIIKIGGRIIENEDALQSFLRGVAQQNNPTILVHGGGTLASELSKKMGIETKLSNGRRITDKATLDIATMVYAGKISKNIVAILQAQNCNAVGLCGADGNSIISEKRPVKDIDFGLVGDVVGVDTSLIIALLSNDMLPVFSAITHDNKGQLLNTNADTIASELAIALSLQYKVKLNYCFEYQGVLADIKDGNSVLATINLKDYNHLKKSGVISNGMIPKLDNCFYALKMGVSSVCIGNPEMITQPKANFTTILL